MLLLLAAAACCCFTCATRFTRSSSLLYKRGGCMMKVHARIHTHTPTTQPPPPTHPPVQTLIDHTQRQVAAQLIHAPVAQHARLLRARVQLLHQRTTLLALDVVAAEVCVTRNRGTRHTSHIPHHPPLCSPEVPHHALHRRLPRALPRHLHHCALRCCMRWGCVQVTMLHALQLHIGWGCAAVAHCCAHAPSV